MNKHTVLMAFCTVFISSSVFACQLTLTNDTKRDITVRDITGHSMTTLKPGAVYVFPTEEQQNFIITENLKITTGVVGPQKRHVHQFACSPSHAISMNVSDIFRYKVDATLFTVSKNR